MGELDAMDVQSFEQLADALRSIETRVAAVQHTHCMLARSASEIA